MLKGGVRHMLKKMQKLRLLTSWLSFVMSNLEVVTSGSGVVLDCIDS